MSTAHKPASERWPAVAAMACEAFGFDAATFEDRKRKHTELAKCRQAAWLALWSSGTESRAALARTTGAHTEALRVGMDKGMDRMEQDDEYRERVRTLERRASEFARAGVAHGMPGGARREG